LVTYIQQGSSITGGSATNVTFIGGTANFNSASISGSGIATLPFVTSQGYVTSSGSISTASNALALNNLPSSSFAQLNTNNSFSGSNVFTSVASTVPITVKGAVSQPANLQEWQDSSGNVKAKVDALGNITASASTPIISVANSSNNQRIALTSPGGGPVIEYGTTTTPQQFGYSGAQGNALTFQGTARPVRFQNTSTTGVVAQFTAASTQTGDLTQWAYGVDSGSLVLAGVNASGQFYTGSSAGLANTQVYITHSASTITPLVIKGGAYANVKLIDIQNYLGGSQFSVNTSGLMQTGNITVNTITNGNSTAPYLGFGSTNSTTAIMYARTSTNVGFIVQGAASATADLQQWQNSSGSTLARISASGTLTVVIDGGSA
jgi:hypothetical protein